MKDILETDTIQHIMQQAILASSPQLHVNLMHALGPLHTAKSTDTQARELLHRLYQPILWRHLNAACAQVRSQALALMLQAFPIEVRHLSLSICCAPCSFVVRQRLLGTQLAAVTTVAWLAERTVSSLAMQCA